MTPRVVRTWIDTSQDQVTVLTILNRNNRASTRSWVDACRYIYTPPNSRMKISCPTTSHCPVALKCCQWQGLYKHFFLLGVPAALRKPEKMHVRQLYKQLYPCAQTHLHAAVWTHVDISTRSWSAACRCAVFYLIVFYLIS